jgi:hypothetical protein
MTRRLLTVLGYSVMAWGLWGLVTHLSAAGLFGWVRFWLAGLIFHDALLMPAVLVVGWFLRRAFPPPARAYVQAGAVVSGVVLLVAAPFVIGAGRRADVPSALPLDYRWSLLVSLAGIWLLVAVTSAVAVARAGYRPAIRHRNETADD